MASTAFPGFRIMNGTTRELAVTHSPAATKHKAKKWRCDVCQVREFTELAAACAHEAICQHQQQQQQQQQQQAEQGHTAATNTAPVGSPHAAAASPKTHTTTSPPQPDSQNDTNAVVVTTIQPRDAGFFHPGGEQKPRAKRKAHSNLPPPDSVEAKGLRRAPVLVAVDDEAVIVRVKGAPARRRKKTKAEATTLDGFLGLPPMMDTNNSTTTLTESLSSLQAAQKVADFSAKRQRQQQVERDRRLKRQRQRQEQLDADELDPSGTTSVSADVERAVSTTKPAAPRASSSSKFAYRPFPVPQHVVGPAGHDETFPPSSTTTTTTTTTAAAATTVPPPQPSLLHAVVSRDDDGGLDPAPKILVGPPQSDCWQRDLPWACRATPRVELAAEEAFTWNASSSPCAPPLRKPCDMLLQALSAFVVMPVDESLSVRAASSPPRPPELDTNNSTHSSSKATNARLLKFLNDWKEVRAASHRRMTERNRKLAGRSPKKVPKTVVARGKGNDEDEDFFLSGSEDSDEEATTLPSLFLITGPVGAGKTAMVHAAAQSTHCGVLEVNTIEIRGAAALRKRIQEATQTHTAAWNKRPTGIAAALMKEKTAAPEGKQRHEDSAAMTIILLDEVDILYPEDGDNGFWSALSDVSKKAKAPIILTANRFPDELRSPAFRFEHAHHAPTVEECAQDLMTLVKSEGFAIRPDRQPFATADALRIAQIAQQDTRRLRRTLQLLKATPSKDFSARHGVDTAMQLLSHPPAAAVASLSLPPLTIPRISGIQPRSVPADSLSLVTIFGEGFLSFSQSPSLGLRGGYPVQVKIGNQHCPQARILDDVTILAVCPPLQVEGDVSLHLMSPDLMYAAVSVSSAQSTGIRSTTGGFLEKRYLAEGTAWLTKPAVTLLGYHFVKGLNSLDNEADGSDKECEFDDTSPQMATVSHAKTDTDQKTVLQILKEGLAAWHSQGRALSHVEETDEDEDEEGLEHIEHVSRAASFASDAALFEDCGLDGLPFLVGGNQSYASSLKANKLQFQRNQKKNVDDWLSGSDCYMVQPALARERRLLCRMEKELRGKPMTYEATDDEDEENSAPLFREESDDSFLLAGVVPISLHALPGYLRNQSIGRYPPIAWDFDFENRRKGVWEHQCSLLKSFTFANNQADIRIFASGLNRDMDCLLDPTYSFDSRILLDYLPLLRRMAVLERAWNHIFQHQEDIAVAESLAHATRATRSSARRGRLHYFQEAFDFLRGLNDSEKSLEVGEAFASRFLSYY
jgi:DNA polymerase III delta prime subunit